MNKIIVICGPTCSGKTEFAIKLALLLGGEVISADSMQVYRYMDIGTAKPSIKEQSIVRHHMLDIVEPDEYFSAYKYSVLAMGIIKKVVEKKKIPIVVGGSGLYINSLMQGLSKSSFKSIGYRKKFYIKTRKYGIKRIYNDLLKINENFVGKIHKNDILRITRALEIFKCTNDSVNLFKKKINFEPFFCDYIVFALLWDRSKLYNRINNRVNIMISQGFVDEVENLLNIGFSPKLRSMRSLGYKHVADFLINKSFWYKTLKNLKRDHRRYAKRQLTWFKPIKTINWVSLDDVKRAFCLIKKFFNF